MERNPTERDMLESGSRHPEIGSRIADARGADNGPSRRGTGTPAPADAPAEGRAVDGRADPRGGAGNDLLKGIHLKVRAELGRTRVHLKDALKLAAGSVVDLHKLAEDPVDLYVGDLLVARGEVLVLNDTFCIRVTEVFAHTGEEES
jgi:flagellar motor switch protein FliN/FliY